MEKAEHEIITLIRNARTGDPDALGVLLTKYRNQLRSLADRKIGESVLRRFDASDVVQQTCLEAHQAFRAFEGESEGELVVWLQRILERNVYDAVRDQKYAEKRAMRKEQSLDKTMGDGKKLRDRLSNEHTSPSLKARNNEANRELTEAIDTLPPDQKQAIQLRHLEHRKLDEIAKIMDKSTTAVASLIHRGIKSLKGKLKQ